MVMVVCDEWIVVCCGVGGCCWDVVRCCADMKYEEVLIDTMWNVLMKSYMEVVGSVVTGDNIGCAR